MIIQQFLAGFDDEQLNGFSPRTGETNGSLLKLDESPLKREFGTHLHTFTENALRVTTIIFYHTKYRAKTKKTDLLLLKHLSIKKLPKTI